MSGAERQRRYLERRLQGAPTDTALKAELAAAKARIAELEAELKAEIQANWLSRRRFTPQQRAAKPKAEKPPLPPDEERERIIKGLRTRVRNLTAELHHVREWNSSRKDNKGSMNFNTMSAIAKALHPDREPSAAERDEALKAFTAWKADNSKARRS